MKFDVVVTVTYEGRVEARSKEDAESQVVADSGTSLTDITDMAVDVTRVRAVTPRTP